jgi:hypothetical protein
MNFDEILAEVGEEKAAVIQSHLDSVKLAERKIGISTSQKKGAENTKLISENARLKDAIREAAGIDDFGDDRKTERSTGRRRSQGDGSEVSETIERHENQLSEHHCREGKSNGAG